MPQLRIFYFFLVLMGIVALICAWVALSTKHAGHVDSHAAYRLRKGFFFGLCAVFLVLLVLTLPNVPYTAETASADRVVHVVGKQFAFALSDNPIATDREWEEGTYAKPVEIPAGSTVEFRVTSLDVNHGFGLYSPSGALLSQTQAMPGYVNRLRTRLEARGRYVVLCMEMCGMDHHKMRAVLDVK